MINACRLPSQGLIAFGLLHLHTDILANWQFLYLLEALPSLIMAIIILLCLPAFPFTARFLTKKQKVIAVARLRDHRPKSHGGTGGWKAVRLVLTDPHCWGFVIIYSTCECKPKADSLTRAINFSRHTLIFSCGFPILSSGWQQSRSMLSDIPHHLAERLFRHCRLLPAYGLYYLVLIFDPPSYMSSHFL